jgi:fatty-acyl-CoA synthase
VSDRLTLGRWISDRARATPDRAAIDYLGRVVTYRELHALADRFAGALSDRGLYHGDRVATLTGNTPEHVALFFACAKAGFILVPLSWRLAAPELAYQLSDAEPALFLVESEYEELAAATGHTFEPLVVPTSGSEPQTRPSDDDPLLLVYTSGTTGKPKGALLTHANCFWTNVGFDIATGVSADDVVLQVLPQFHCGGWNVQLLLALWKGARVVLERGFDADHALELIEEKRVTTTMGVPANYLFMAHSPRFGDTDLGSLRRAVVGGAPMPLALLETWRGRGVDIVQGYGLTEAAPNVLCLAAEDAVRKAGYAGKPYPHVDVKLSAEGELLVRGPNVFAGYWRNDEATAAAFADGWLRTGDIAERDDEGNYRISGRLKDMYISGGENVYPAEIEDVLISLEGVADAAVLGVPDERWGEVGVAFVVVEDASLTADDIVAACRERVARFKVPASVRFVDELPRSGMNKVRKDELRALLETEVPA